MALIVFEGMTTLDFAGFYDAVVRLRILNLMESVSWEICGVQEEIRDEALGTVMRVEKILPDLSGYDLIFIPGGRGTRTLRSDEAFVSWLKTAESVPYKVSVCTGALLLGAAGFLEGRRATTNPPAYGLLGPYCGKVVRARVVRDGQVFTGGGVSASIDLALYVLESLTDADAVRQIQKMMDYPYYETGRVNGDYGVIPFADPGAAQ